MTGIPLVIAFVIAIILIIVAISKWKIHPFLSIMSVSLLLAIVAGIDLAQIADVIGAGFSGTFTSIGIVIILGAMVGTLLEKTGAALKMADCVVKLVGKKHPEAAMIIMGWIVSIPVFCDSGFVILNPIRKALVQRTRKSSVACTVALSMGLYISHCFIPPTPGPIAAANTLFGVGGLGTDVNLLLVMAIGAALFAAAGSLTSGLHWVDDSRTWGNILGLAIPATAVSNIALVKAIKAIGPTLTSILGAMEPLTAVLIGVLHFGESFTAAGIAGVVLSVAAVTIVVTQGGKPAGNA